MAVRDKSPKEMARSNVAGAATRKAKAARVAEIEANPIDWGKQVRNIRDFMDELDRRDAAARRSHRYRETRRR